MKRTKWFAKTKIRPRYQHDCNTCQFLGWFGHLDVYVCLPIHPLAGVSILARYHNGPGDYLSRGFSKGEWLNAKRTAPRHDEADRHAALSAAATLMGGFQTEFMNWRIK